MAKRKAAVKKPRGAAAIKSVEGTPATGTAQMAKPSKSEAIRKHKADNPKATVKEIAEATGNSYTLVYQVLSKKTGKKGKKTGPKARLARIAAADNGHYMSVNKATGDKTSAARQFIKDAGGINAAIEILLMVRDINSTPF